jgi:hypothetical protein
VSSYPGQEGQYLANWDRGLVSGFLGQEGLVSSYLGQERAGVWLPGTGAGWCLATWNRIRVVFGYLGQERPAVSGYLGQERAGVWLPGTGAGWCLASWDRSGLVSGGRLCCSMGGSGFWDSAHVGEQSSINNYTQVGTHAFFVNDHR